MNFFQQKQMLVVPWYIYIKNPGSYKTRNNINVNAFFELESTFIEIYNPKKTCIIVGCIYKRPNMSVNEFNDDYLNRLLDKLSKENKAIFLLIDFKINLLTYDTDPRINKFLDSTSCHYLPSHTIQSLRVTSNWKILTDNIFSNMASPNITSVNSTASISNHLPQFLVAPNIFFNSSHSNSHKVGQNLMRKLLCLTIFQLT